MSAYNPPPVRTHPASDNQRHLATIPGDGVAVVPHPDSLNGQGTGSGPRALLAAAGTLLGQSEIALSRFTERQLRIAAFPRPRHCARCYRWAPEPGALVEQARHEPQLPAEWWCRRCVELVRAEREALAGEAALRAEVDNLWHEHQDRCPACRRWGSERSVARRFCPTGGR